MSELDAELIFDSYDGVSDIAFNQECYDSLILQYSDYVTKDQAIQAVSNFQPNRDFIKDTSCCTAAYLNGSVIGLVCVSPFKTDEFLVSKMEVLEQYRRKSVGTKLLASATAEKDPCNVYVSVHRKAAQLFYSKNEFKLIEKTKLNLYGFEMEFCYMQRA